MHRVPYPIRSAILLDIKIHSKINEGDKRVLHPGLYGLSVINICLTRTVGERTGPGRDSTLYDFVTIYRPTSQRVGRDRSGRLLTLPNTIKSMAFSVIQSRFPLAFLNSASRYSLDSSAADWRTSSRRRYCFSGNASSFPGLNLKLLSAPILPCLTLR
ncbi:uncharacterized protein EI90DRAFT_1904770 [Cantharellus anzutake]|uniref:uncharacterized protein n=1 Tax=Cantharellus anzutake TaxID=1750568 RepID=UPI0019050A7B|nr:uncharacterized protein EI90DRAFT_1904770 [Cantharellus anzutake]KAF8326549.1 hypothetical protein EI90DRAFT_1904770 [Cantharellus anzutake]